jgi:polyhydroxybutyrate depolymerase
MDMSQMGPAADRRGVAVAAPNGAVIFGANSHQWHVPGGLPVPPGTPDDEQYLLRVIKTVKDTLCIDGKRVYLTGYSGGARMASQFACDHAREVAGIAPVSGLRAGFAEPAPSGGFQPDPKTCRPDEVVPVLAFHGTEDPLNPYAANDDPIWGYSVETALARWAKINRCQRGPRTRIISVSVEKLAYRDCRAHGKVALYRANGAGHTWPGSTFPAVGPIDQTINATELMLDFFAKHPQQE